MFTLIKQDKNYFMYSFGEHITILIGRNQIGNDYIITECQEEFPDAIWYHLANETYAHGILVPKPEATQSNKIKASHWIKLCLTKNKDDDIVLTKLKHIEKTKTPGLVTYNNEFYMTNSNWIDVFN